MQRTKTYCFHCILWNRPPVRHPGRRIGDAREADRMMQGTEATAVCGAAKRTTAGKPRIEPESTPSDAGRRDAYGYEPETGSDTYDVPAVSVYIFVGNPCLTTDQQYSSIFLQTLIRRRPWQAYSGNPLALRRCSSSLSSRDASPPLLPPPRLKWFLATTTMATTSPGKTLATSFVFLCGRHVRSCVLQVRPAQDAGKLGLDHRAGEEGVCGGAVRPVPEDARFRRNPSADPLRRPHRLRALPQGPGHTHPAPEHHHQG
jgi:hypothetical protein